VKKKSLLGNALLFLTAMIWGTAFVGQRVGMESIEPITFNAARMTLSAVMIGALAIIFSKKNASSRSHEERSVCRKNTVLGGVFCGVFLAAASIFQQMGLVYTSAGKAGFITAMYMLFVPMIHFLLFHKKNSLFVWIAVIMGLGGMYLLCVTESFSLTFGDGLVFVCAILFSGHILCCDHFAPLGDAIGISAIQFVTASVISWVFAFITEMPTTEKLLSAVIPIIYCGVMSGGIGYTLQIVAQKYTDPTVASLLMSLESVFAVIAGVFLLDETMSIRETVGCIVMFAAIVLVQIPFPQKKK